MKYKDKDEFVNLEKYAPESCWEVMYIGTTKEGIDMYKHCETRNYMNIDNDGNFYIYNGEEYSKTDLATAIDLMLQ